MIGHKVIYITRYNTELARLFIFGTNINILCICVSSLAGEMLCIVQQQQQLKTHSQVEFDWLILVANWIPSLISISRVCESCAVVDSFRPEDEVSSILYRDETIRNNEKFFSSLCVPHKSRADVSKRQMFGETDWRVDESLSVPVFSRVGQDETMSGAALPVAYICTCKCIIHHLERWRREV